MNGIFAFLTVIAATNLALSTLLPQVPAERPTISWAAEADAIKSDRVIYYDAPLCPATTYLR